LNKKGAGFAEYQQKTCNEFCHREIGPICHEEINKNLRWPLTKAKNTAKQPCFRQKSKTNKLIHFKNTSSDTNNESNDNKMKFAYRYCNYNYGAHKSAQGLFSVNSNNSFPLLSNVNLNKLVQTNWQAPNIDECISDSLLKLKKEIFLFSTTDNFDEKYIIIYAQQLYNSTVNNIRSNKQRTIYDISTIIDVLFYLIDAQVILIQTKNEDQFFFKKILLLF
jgi:hypothetical protein